MRLSGRIHLSQTNGGVKLSLFIYPSSPESFIFQLEAAGKRLWREVCDPDDSGGTTANCGTEIDFENTNEESEKGWIQDLCDRICSMTHTHTHTFQYVTNNGWI